MRSLSGVVGASLSPGARGRRRGRSESDTRAVRYCRKHGPLGRRNVEGKHVVVVGEVATTKIFTAVFPIKVVKVGGGRPRGLAMLTHCGRPLHSDAARCICSVADNGAWPCKRKIKRSLTIDGHVISGTYLF